MGILHSVFNFNNSCADCVYIINRNKWSRTCMYSVNKQKEQFCECRAKMKVVSRNSHYGFDDYRISKCRLDLNLLDKSCSICDSLK